MKNDKKIRAVAEEAVRLYFDSNCTAEEAIQKAKEVLKDENNI